MKEWRYICLLPHQIDRITYIDGEQIILDVLEPELQQEENFDFHDLIENHKGLTDKQREVIMYRIIDELTFEEIAELMITSRQNIHEIYKTGINNLRKDMTWLKV